MRQYPALVNCTTIDWFCEWPADALLEVADKYLENTELANEEEVTDKLFSFHQLFVLICDRACEQIGVLRMKWLAAFPTDQIGSVCDVSFVIFEAAHTIHVFSRPSIGQLSLAILLWVGSLSTDICFARRWRRNCESCVAVGPVTRTAGIFTLLYAS